MKQCAAVSPLGECNVCVDDNLGLAESLEGDRRAKVACLPVHLDALLQELLLLGGEGHNTSGVEQEAEGHSAPTRLGNG